MDWNTDYRYGIYIDYTWWPHTTDGNSDYYPRYVKEVYPPIEELPRSINITTVLDQIERRDKMISKSVFNEALAEAGVAKNVRRKVEKLSSNDFEFLIATLLVKAFDPEMLKVFEEPVQKVKVVEEELPF